MNAPTQGTVYPVLPLRDIVVFPGMIVPLFATALIADLVSALVCRERLYHGLAKPFLRSPIEEHEVRG